MFVIRRGMFLLSLTATCQVYTVSLKAGLYTYKALQCSERCAADLASALQHGTLRPVLDRVFPLAELPAAHAYMLSNSQFGKIVLRTDDVEG
jgi:NADPH:quinone reductase-like Zn-dependent oxidoreductase